MKYCLEFNLLSKLKWEISWHWHTGLLCTSKKQSPEHKNLVELFNPDLYEDQDMPYPCIGTAKLGWDGQFQLSFKSVGQLVEFCLTNKIEVDLGGIKGRIRHLESEASKLQAKAVECVVFIASIKDIERNTSED